jgi:hypothetical protein
VGLLLVKSTEALRHRYWTKEGRLIEVNAEISGRSLKAISFGELTESAQNTEQNLSYGLQLRPVGTAL